MIPKLKNPIVLVHGLWGHGEVRLGHVKLAEYFPGITQRLRACGNRVLIPRLSLAASVAERAGQLKAFLDRECPDEPVHLVAHSMGGLDSRYMIARLGMADRVQTLTTLGTPHRGTCFADWAIQRLERILRPVFALLRLPVQGYYDLTTAACKRFNDETPDSPRVRYFSVAGRHDGSVLTPEWYLSYSLVLKHEGENDGVVSVQSARWGERLDIWDGDHFSLVNWLNPFARNRGWLRNPAERYGPLICRLKDEGY
jgi:triacylglycerol lipase